MANKVKWILGLIIVIASAVVTYLSTGCTPAELARVNQGAAAAQAVCAYIEGRTEPEYAKAKEACKRNAEVKEVLRAAADCSAK